MDYIFIPLGGSRCGKGLLLRNIMVVTLLSGLWHGASWNFVLWGVYHGIALCVWHLYRQWRGDTPGPFPRLATACSTLFTFVVAMTSWALFAIDSGSLLTAFSKMFHLP